jgi:hypothetical protein
MSYSGMGFTTTKSPGPLHEMARKRSKKTGTIIYATGFESLKILIIICLGYPMG